MILLYFNADILLRKVEGNYWPVGLGRKSISYTLSSAWKSVKDIRNNQRF